MTDLRTASDHTHLPGPARIRLGSLIMTVDYFHRQVAKYRLVGIQIPVFGFLLAGEAPAEIARRMGWTTAYARTVISRVLWFVDSKGDRRAICRRLADELYGDIPAADPLALSPVPDAALRQRHKGGRKGGRRAGKQGREGSERRRGAGGGRNSVSRHSSASQRRLNIITL